MSGPDRRWYVVQTQTHREHLAAEHLARQGYGVFFPRQRRMARHARRLTERLVGYFPGYLFVSLDLRADRWRSVNGTIGVRGLIMGADRPAAAPAGLVEALQGQADARGCLAPPPAYGPGDRVRLLSGPFADLVGTLDRLEGLARVRILIELVNGVVPVVADSHDVELAG
ncbi:MAG: transcription antiterminator NusG [Caulobacteraceae bacterium]|nr:transcription antiterminator NusG [Caulobacteraceae bacterium]